MEEIRELSKVRSSSGGTSLVTLMIPPNVALGQHREQVQQELGTSKNIKNKTVRKDVASALKSCAQQLKPRHPDTAPPNGLVVCCGATAQCYV